MREDRITIAKAIAIILMVAGHAGVPSEIGRFINMFHMPLFFFVSGYCFKEKYLNYTKQFAINKVKGLYVPFIKWSLLFLLLHNVFFHLNIYNATYGFRGEASHLYDMKETLFHATKIVVAMNGTEQLLGGYWFLKQLFVGSFISLLFFKYLRGKIAAGGGILLVITMLMSYLNIDIPIIRLTSLGFFSAFFIVMGKVYKENCLKMISLWLTCLFFILVIVGSIICNTSLLAYKTWQIIPYSIFAIMGTIMVLNVSYWISNSCNAIKHLLMFIGDHTLEILTWHFLCFKIVSLLIIEIHGLPIEQLAYFPTVRGYSHIYWPLYTIVGVSMPLLFTCCRIKIHKYVKTK